MRKSRIRMLTKMRNAMKKILLSLLFTLPVLAQDGFTNNNGHLVWQRTYPATTDINAALQNTQGIQIVAAAGSNFTGMGDEVSNTCQGGTALMSNKCKFDFDVKMENGNYLVTITNIRIIEKMGPMQARILANRAEKYFVNADLKIRKDTRTQTDMACLDNFLTDLFNSETVHASGALSAN